MWPWGALPLRPPPQEPVGTCRVAWDALPLLPLAIPASYLFDGEGPQAPFLIAPHCAAVVSVRRGRRSGWIGSERSTWEDARSGTYPGERKGRHARPDKSRNERLNGRALSGFSPRPENPHGACSLPEIDRNCRSSSAVLVASDQSAAAPDCIPKLATLRAAVSRAADPGPFPERVSAFPSSGEGPGSVACNQRLSAFATARSRDRA